MATYNETYYGVHSRDNVPTSLTRNTATVFVDVKYKYSNYDSEQCFADLNVINTRNNNSVDNNKCNLASLYRTVKVHLSTKHYNSLENNDIVVFSEFNGSTQYYNRYSWIFETIYKNFAQVKGNFFVHATCGRMPYVVDLENNANLIVHQPNITFNPSNKKTTIKYNADEPTIKFPVLQDCGAVESNGLARLFNKLSTGNVHALYLKPGFKFDINTVSYYYSNDINLSLSSIRDPLYNSWRRDDPTLKTTIYTTNTEIIADANFPREVDKKLVLNYESDNPNALISLDEIYRDISDACNEHYDLFLTSKKLFSDDINNIIINKNKERTLFINDISPGIPAVEINTKLKIHPGIYIDKLHYTNYNKLNLDSKIKVSFNGGIVHRIVSPYAMNLYVEVYQDGDTVNGVKEVHYFPNTSSETVVLKTGAAYKIAAWSLGKATYFKQDVVPTIINDTTILIEWIDYERDVLNLNALVSVAPLMTNIKVDNTSTGIELKLPELNLNADEAKMILHLLSSTKPGLEATVKGGSTIVSRINTDRFSLFAPMFTVVKQDHLTNEQKVVIDLFIDDSIAIRQDPSYIPNPYRANGRVELRSTPPEPPKVEEPEPEIDVKSLAQETVETLLRHPQFLSTSAMSLTLDK